MGQGTCVFFEPCPVTSHPLDRSHLLKVQCLFSVVSNASDHALSLWSLKDNTDPNQNKFTKCEHFFEQPPQGTKSCSSNRIKDKQLKAKYSKDMKSLMEKASGA